MANTIRIKRRAAGGASGAPSSLANAELAFNEQDNVLYYGKGTGGSGGSATTVEVVGGLGAFVSITTNQTVSGIKTFSSAPIVPTQLASDDSTKAASTAYVKSQNYGTVTSVAAITLGNTGTDVTSTVSTNTTTPVITLNIPTASANSRGVLSAADWVTFNGNSAGVNTGDNAVNTLYSGLVTNATHTGDATGATVLTLATVNSNIGTFNNVTINAKGLATAGSNVAYLTSYTETDTLAAVTGRGATTAVASTFSGGISMSASKITNLATPTEDTDAATKAYVDATRQGLAVKDAVRVATTANITLSAPQTIDAIAAIAGDRVLVKNQTTGSENGLYLVAAGAWTRTVDADAPNEMAGGDFVFVQEGTTNADSGWVCTNDGTVTIGTTALTFTQFSGAGQVLAGAGLTKTGSTFDVIGTADRILVNADSVDIASTYVGQASITTLGTITTGTWTGTTIAVANGGTGAATLTGILKGNGTGAFTAATDGTDYLSSTAAIDGGVF
jgi:hypothetical protein